MEEPEQKQAVREVGVLGNAVWLVPERTVFGNGTRSVIARIDVLEDGAGEDGAYKDYGLTYNEARRKVAKWLSSPEMQKHWATWVAGSMVIATVTAYIGLVQWHSAGHAKASGPDEHGRDKGVMAARGQAINNLARGLLSFPYAWQAVLDGSTQKGQGQCVRQ